MSKRERIICRGCARRNRCAVGKTSGGGNDEPDSEDAVLRPRRDAARLHLRGGDEAHPLEGTGDRGRNLDLAEAIAARGGQHGSLQLGGLGWLVAGDGDGHGVGRGGTATATAAGAGLSGIGQTGLREGLINRRRRDGRGRAPAP